MRKLLVDLAIPAEKYLQLYSGRATDVVARSRDGLSVRFPGSALHRFVTHDGIIGTFEITIDDNNKLMGVTKIA